MPSIRVPFSIAASGKVESTTTNEKIIEQQIIDVLSTSEFERVMRPLYGANAVSLLFEPLDELIFSEFKVDALEKLNRNVSGAAVVDMDVEPLEIAGDTVLSITAKYSMRTGSIKTFSFQVTFPSLLTEESAI